MRTMDFRAAEIACSPVLFVPSGCSAVKTTFRSVDGKTCPRTERSERALSMAVRKSPVALLPGSLESEVVPELGPEPEDLVLNRLHGLNPMAGTDLDPVLRNLGISTVIVTGVSVNVAITNLVMDAVNHGYQVVLPRDAVCGLPADYADAVIDNTLSLLATVTTVDDLVAAWASTSEDPS